MSNWEEPLWVVNRIGNKLKEFALSLTNQIQNGFKPVNDSIKNLHKSLVVPADKVVQITTFVNAINISGKGYITSICLASHITARMVGIELKVDDKIKISFPDISAYGGYGHYISSNSTHGGCSVTHDIIIPFEKGISLTHKYPGESPLTGYITYVLTD